MKNKKIEFKTLEVAFLLIITCIFSTLTGYLVGYKLNSKTESDYVELDENLQSFINEYNEIKENYYGDFDGNVVLSNALAAVLLSLGDEYSGILDSSSSNKDNVTLTGEYEGVGVEIVNDEDYNIFVTKVYENTPAYEAGIKANDQIVKFNDESVLGITTSELVSKIKQTNNEIFSLELLRDNKTLTVQLKIENIVLKSVSFKKYEIEGKKIGYINMSIFANNTYRQFATALSELEKENIEGLIIDVRNNPGGYLSTATNIADLLLNKDKIVYQTQSKEEVVKFYSNGNKDYDKKIVVLINGDSASASELLASTLNENLGSTLVGTKSYGKGTVQEINSYQTTKYKYTTKLWLTANGKAINGVGIEPDVVVENDKKYEENPTEENDKQLQTAIQQFSEKE